MGQLASDFWLKRATDYCSGKGLVDVQLVNKYIIPLLPYLSFLRTAREVHEFERLA